MITASQCLEAAELLEDREVIAEKLKGMRASLGVRLAYKTRTSFGTDDDPDHVKFQWTDGVELPMSDAFRDLLTAATTAELSAIDRKLRKLGVEPPADEEPA